MKVKVYLHGYFAKFHEGPIEVEAETVAQAVGLVTRQLRGFQPNAVHGRHRIAIAGCDQIEDLYRPAKNGEIHLVPQFAGGKRGGFLQILLGVALVAVGWFIGATWLLQAGALMVLGGIAQFLMPTPDSEDQRKSRYLGAPGNTVEIGTRIPVLYGEDLVYGHFLSFDTDATVTSG
ncbi:tail assembly protein [Nitratireductor aquibiodomus]|uniref:tail assembly protein n=1 Tax=Nitratireductor TaxID=245876 RepID=UPI0019D340D4|nr:MULTISPECIES: tail assembly protein [Nitratireductor]MBN7759789.1 tail assembly protein [Nitratireductor aquibiodomus]MCV0350184.1 hypothetical protein [Nitratireductor sp.]MDV2968718.1 hypothetical protein [Nitratireductor aquimarinus]